MTKQWRSDRKRDHYYRKAKREQYRSRASYKLIQLNEKYSIISPGNTIVDLGASPGGWSQVAVELGGPESKIFAMDVDRFAPIEGVTFVRGDIREEAVVLRLLGEMPGGADVVLSDMSPNISGNYSYDHARSLELCEHALVFAERVLKPGGRMVVKMFFGDMSKTFVDAARKRFDVVHVTHPGASRKSSSEVYVVAIGFRARSPSPRTSSSSRK